MSTAELPPPDVLVPFERVATMVRQLTHDVRNGFSAMELQSAYVAELLRDPEDLSDAASELKRLRGMIAENTNSLRRFSARFRVTQPGLVAYPARMFTEDCRARMAKALPDFAPQVAWTEDVADEVIPLDFEMVSAALGEIFQNAAHFQERGEPVTAHASAKAGRFQIELREHHAALPSAPATWGREPFVSTRPGGHGLGIFHARQLLAAHGGGVDFTYDPASAQLTTRVFLPLA